MISKRPTKLTAIKKNKGRRIEMSASIVHSTLSTNHQRSIWKMILNFLKNQARSTSNKLTLMGSPLLVDSQRLVSKFSWSEARKLSLSAPVTGISSFPKEKVNYHRLPVVLDPGSRKLLHLTLRITRKGPELSRKLYTLISMISKWVSRNLIPLCIYHSFWFFLDRLARAMKNGRITPLKG